MGVCAPPVDAVSLYMSSLLGRLPHSVLKVSRHEDVTAGKLICNSMPVHDRAAVAHA